MSLILFSNNILYFSIGGAQDLASTITLPSTLSCIFLFKNFLSLI
jgi:hypothetical protein